jgi:DNA-directed RNA polymerase subunit omega
MARITIEDCLGMVSDRFELVALAAQRSRALAFGEPSLLLKGKDKYAVLALREIASRALDMPKLKEMLIKRNQRKQIIRLEDKVDQADPVAESAYQKEMESFAVAPKKRAVIEEDDEEI